MRTIRTLLSVLAAGACATALVPAVAQAAPTAPYTALVIDDTQVGGYDAGAWDASNATMVPMLNDGDQFALEARWSEASDPRSTRVDVWPPYGETWQEGRTYPASTSPGLDKARLRVDAVQCVSDGGGSVWVRQVSRDPATGALTAFAAAYDFHCDNRTEVADGEIRWNSDEGYSAVLPSGPLDFGRVEVGRAPVTRTETFASKGSGDAAFGTARIEGADPAAFTITGDTCSGRVLPAGEVCTVTIAGAPTKGRVQTASLVMPDNTGYGQRTESLTVEGWEGVIGTYYPLTTPSRLMDTRNGTGVSGRPIAPGETVELQVAGRGGLPTGGLSAVVLNVTVTGPTASSFLTVYPADEERPNASSINFPAGWLGSNNVTVKLSADGRIKVYNRTGYTHAVVDVSGFYAGSNWFQPMPPVGAQHHPLTPRRLFDTRTDGGAIPARGSQEGFVDFGPELSPKVRSLVLNVTAVAPAKAGFLTVWSGEGGLPISSTVNYAAGKVVPNLVVVKTRACTDCGRGYALPAFSVYTSQTANVVVDLVGVFDDGTVADGLRFTPVSPTRIVDSRTGLGTSGALGANVTRKVTTPSALVTDATRALAMNVTAVSPTTSTVITVWPADTGAAKPTASNLNPAAGQIVSNAVFTGIGPKDAFNVHNLSGSTHLVADVVGSYWLYPATASGSAPSATSPFVVLSAGHRAR
ncbi:hypothetical protein [Micromonospora sp. 4G55]|uniref:hypothetical protein n=1 Tax=Micromonospora sp. 4G55 TaxID=2806102 RepID=UPI001A3BC44E|nr:hypothetical protein [Micromonospora sp. 4G55]MBM0255722.1 hypothetical protein [Micromonospora sp. 4G55]